MEHRTNELKFLMDYRIFQSWKVSGREHGSLSLLATKLLQGQLLHGPKPG